MKRPRFGSQQAAVTAMSFQPARLTIARELRGLTRGELADRVHVPAAHLARLEVASVEPDPGTLARLALGLGMPIEFFGRPTAGLPIAVESCHFRHLRPAAHVSRRRVLAVAALFIDLLGLLSKHFTLPPEVLGGIELDPASADPTESLALSLRRKWGLGLLPVRSVTRLIESRGIAVQHIDEVFDDVTSFSFWHAQRPLVLVSSGKYAAAARFDLAHELGHLLMHADVKAGLKQDESEADHFARAFLMPAKAFELECPRLLDWDAIFALKKRWQVPVPSLLERGFELGILSEPTYLRGLCLHRTELRHAEPAEPPAEKPRLVEEALELLGAEWSPSRIASELSVSAADARFLLQACGVEGGAGLAGNG
jgi:Zn-dependent peptidase ImmA (M78 family)/transcriptional regulator with XRE-family HTH domain